MTRTVTRRPLQSSPPLRVLVATDFSPDAAYALGQGRDLAERLGAELVVLHVDQPLLAGARSNADLRRRREAEDKLHRLAAASRRPARAILRIGTPAREIVETAAVERATMIVLGTRGRSAIVGAFLGGVAYDVVRKAPCPVLTVRRPAPTSRNPRRTKASTGAREPLHR